MIKVQNVSGNEADFAALQASVKDLPGTMLLTETLSRADIHALEAACDEVEEEEDHHYYHTMGWVRELAAQSLGMPAVLPPPEEEKDVKTATGAQRAKAARKKML